MTKLEEHIVEIDGKKYVPLDIAQIAVLEGISEEIQNTQSLIKDAFSGLTNSLKDLDD